MRHAFQQGRTIFHAVSRRVISGVVNWEKEENVMISLHSLSSKPLGVVSN